MTQTNKLEKLLDSKGWKLREEGLEKSHKKHYSLSWDVSWCLLLQFAEIKEHFNQEGGCFCVRVEAFGEAPHCLPKVSSVAFERGHEGRDDFRVNAERTLEESQELVLPTCEYFLVHSWVDVEVGDLDDLREERLLLEEKPLFVSETQEVPPYERSLEEGVLSELRELV